jgi:hypothetical protein
MPDWGRIGAGIMSGGMTEFPQKDPFGVDALGGPARHSQYGMDPGGKLAGASADALTAAGRGDVGYRTMTGQLAGDRAYLQDLRSGKNSLAAEQLRQGLEAQQAQIQGMAAGARPADGPMAARTAIMSMGRAGSAMAGNAAMARIAEQNAAAQTLAGLNLQQRGQDISYAGQQRGLGIQGLGTLEQSAASRYAADLGAPSKSEVLLGGLVGVTKAAMGGKGR